MAYTTSQLDFAVHFLQTNPHTLLVTIDIGANDLFVLQKQCKGSVACIQAGLPAMLSALGANLDTIYGAIRNTAHYHHQLVALTYYSLNYGDPLGTGIISEVNQVVADRTQAWDGAVADGFGAFKAASTSAVAIPAPRGYASCWCRRLCRPMIRAMSIHRRPGAICWLERSWPSCTTTTATATASPATQPCGMHV